MTRSREPIIIPEVLAKNVIRYFFKFDKKEILKFFDNFEKFDLEDQIQAILKYLH